MGAEFAGVMLDLWRRYDDKSVDLSPSMREILNRAPRTFAQWTEANLDAFRPPAA